MTNLLLVTAVLRTDNLIPIAKNIVTRFAGETEVDPIWVLCFDQYNADISPLKIKKVEVYCLEHNLKYLIYYQGQKDVENYGGALMNLPLQDIKNKLFTDSNPLVYVLDDDNIIHPLFLKYIKEYCLDNERTHWLNMLDEFGAQRFSRYADRLAGVRGTGINEKYYIIHPCASCDPSQVVIRLNTLLNIGGFESVRDYDYKFMNKILSNYKGLNDSMDYQGNRPWIRTNDFYISCYHNGLVTKKKLEEIKNDLLTFSDFENDSYIRIHTKNNSVILPVVGNDLREIIDKKLKELEDESKQ